MSGRVNTRRCALQIKSNHWPDLGELAVGRAFSVYACTPRLHCAPPATPLPCPHTPLPVKQLEWDRVVPARSSMYMATSGAMLREM
jgi:hypothetical protein